MWSRPRNREMGEKWVHPAQSQAGQSRHMPPQHHSRPRPRRDRSGLPLSPQQGLPVLVWALVKLCFHPNHNRSGLSESRPGRRKWPHLKIINMQG